MSSRCDKDSFVRLGVISIQDQGGPLTRPARGMICLGAC